MAKPIPYNEIAIRAGWTYNETYNIWLDRAENGMDLKDRTKFKSAKSLCISCKLPNWIIRKD